MKESSMNKAKKQEAAAGKRRRAAQLRKEKHHLPVVQNQVANYTFHAERATAAEIFREPSRDPIDAARENAQGYLDTLFEQNARPRAACAAKCSWCCHTPVSATMPEVLAIAAALQSLDSERL